jgi:glucosyl-dolichyl phosphate glucuronosyltransferase
MNVSSVSVLICTYNRASLLRDSLRVLGTLTPPPQAEAQIIVVDNNSTDETPEVIAQAVRASPIPIVGVREERQGKSFALNSGFERAHGDIIALTDDDVIPATDWLQRIVTDFRERDVTFVFGKVLPWWSRRPPPELLMQRAQAIWGPLAIVDYGDVPIDYLPEVGGRLPIGANLALRRDAVAKIGAWRTDLGKVNNSLISGEDHEIFMRFRRAGLYAGFYDPELTVRHLVPEDRLTRRYFRKWFFWHGRTSALMLDDLFPELDMTRVPRIGGVPRFMYREGLRQCWRWMGMLGGKDALGVFIEELYTLRFAGMVAECWQRQLGRTRLPSSGVASSSVPQVVSVNGAGAVGADPEPSRRTIAS